MASKLLILLLMTILATPLCLALDCNSLTNSELCNYITRSGVSNQEKDYLISDIISSMKDYPDHAFVRQWNLKIDTSKAPQNVTKYSSGFIKNAWVKIFAVMPSVLEENKLYCADNDEVLTGFNHDVQLSYSLIGDDCNTNYKIMEETSDLKVYVNGVYQGAGRLANLLIDKDSEIRADYTVVLRTKIDHYKWNNYCCKRNRKNGACTRWCSTCDLDSIEYRVDSLKATDTLNVNYYAPEPAANFSVSYSYSDMTKGIFSAEDYSSVQLSFTNSYLSKYNYIYSIVSDDTLHDVLTIRADKANRTEQDNLVYQDDEVTVKDTTNCKIDIYDHFHSRTIPCNLKFEDLGISVSTDKLAYKPDEQIKVSLSPKDKIFNITYAGQSYAAKDVISLKAVYPHNKISLTYNGITYDHIIHLKNVPSLNLMFSVTVFGFLNYIVLRLIQRFWGAIV